MTLVEQVILDTGGRIVYSCTLDEYGRTIGAPVTHNAPRHCSVCGELGHTIRKCNSMRTKPEKMRDKVREVIAKHARAGDLEATRRILADMAAARRRR